MELFALIGLLVVALVLVILIQSETYTAASLIVTGTLLYFLVSNGFTDTFTWLIKNLPLVVAAFASYLSVGVLWSFFKWDRFVGKRIRALKAKAAEYGRTLGKDAVPDWKEHKGDLGGWIIWWPFSVVGFIVGDMLLEIVRYLQNLFGNVYKNIAERHTPGGASRND